MMRKSVYPLGLIFALCICLHGCKTIDLSQTGLGSAKQTAANNIAEVPDDASKVIVSTGRLMTGSPVSPTVVFNNGVAKGIIRETGVEKGFVMTQSRLQSYEVAEGNPDRRNINAVLDFENPLGRKCQEEISLTYRIRNSGLHVLTGSAKPIFDRVPRAVCFMVPENKIPCTSGILPKTFESLYQKIATDALVPGDQRLTGKEANWGMAVFFMDRISPSANFKLAVSASEKGFGGYEKASRYADYNGWRVGFTAGKFAIKKSDGEEALFLKAVYTPGREAGFIKRSFVTGLYALKQ